VPVGPAEGLQKKAVMERPKSSRASMSFEGSANPLTGGAADDDLPSVKYTLRREATQHFRSVTPDKFETLLKSIKNKEYVNA